MGAALGAALRVTAGCDFFLVETVAFFLGAAAFFFFFVETVAVRVLVDEERDLVDFLLLGLDATFVRGLPTT